MLRDAKKDYMCYVMQSHKEKKNRLEESAVSPTDFFPPFFLWLKKGGLVYDYFSLLSIRS